MTDDLYMTDPRAKSIEGFIAGLTILARHMKDGIKTAFPLGAEHDVIHIWGEVDLAKVPEDSDDGRALCALGFHADDGAWAYFT